MPATGGQAQRISFGDGSYSTPVWSPTGEYIAFTKQTSDAFAIGVMKPDGSGERILTSGFHNEGPTFCPNGRVIMFFRDPGGTSGPSLYSIDISGAPTSAFRRRTMGPIRLGRRSCRRRARINYGSMSASLRERPKCCIAAKRRDGP